MPGCLCWLASLDGPRRVSSCLHYLQLGDNDPMTGKVFEFIRKARRLPQVEKMEMVSQMAKLMKKVFGGSDGTRALVNLLIDLGSHDVGLFRRPVLLSKLLSIVGVILSIAVACSSSNTVSNSGYGRLSN
jgi:hypothetical protein